MGSPEYDSFGDVIDKQSGIFGTDAGGLSDGLGEHDSTKTQATPGGVVVEMFCRGCGRPCRIVAEYPELVAVKYSVSPRMAFGAMPNVIQVPVEWLYSSVTGGWYPDEKCQQCRSPCNPHFTPNEAEQHLATARSKNWINPQGEQQLSQIAVAARQRVAQQMGR